MKTLGLMLALCLPLAAQSGVDIVNNANGSHTLTNHSGKTIVLLAGTINWGGATTPFIHEYLFKNNGWAVNTSFTDDGDPKAPEQGRTVTFVQFIDGSQWGDPNSGPAQSALKVREAELSMLPLLTAGTEQDFSSALAASQTDPIMQAQQRVYRQMVAASGVEGAFADAKARWVTAQSRSNLWKFRPSHIIQEPSSVLRDPL